MKAAFESSQAEFSETRAAPRNTWKERKMGWVEEVLYAEQILLLLLLPLLLLLLSGTTSVALNPRKQMYF